MYQDIYLPLLPRHPLIQFQKPGIYSQFHFKILFSEIWNSGFFDIILRNQLIRVVSYEKLRDMREQRMCLTCEGKWCEDHKCKNSYFVVYNPYNREDEDLEIQEEMVVANDESFLDGDQFDQISEGDVEPEIEEEFKELNDCIMLAEKSEWELQYGRGEQLQSDPIVEVKAESIEESLAPDVICPSYQMPERNYETIVKEEDSIFEGLKVFNDKPERESQQDFLSCEIFFETDSIGPEYDLYGPENEFIENFLGFSKWYKRPLVPAWFYECGRQLGYKNKLKTVIGKNVVCFVVKKGNHGMSRFLFDPGGKRRTNWKNINHSSLATAKSVLEEHPVKVFGWAVKDTIWFIFPFEFCRRETGEEYVRFKVLFGGIGHSNLHNFKNELGNSTAALVPGHELVGVATEVGTKVTKVKVCGRVGGDCMVVACHSCDNCQNNLDNYCPKICHLLKSVCEKRKGICTENMVLRSSYTANSLNFFLWVLTGMTVQLLYLLLFLLYSYRQKRLKVLAMMLLEAVFLELIAGLVLSLAHKHKARSLIVGTLAGIGNILIHTSLSIMRMVIVTTSVEFMPFLLLLASLANDIAGPAYSLIRFDPLHCCTHGRRMYYMLEPNFSFALFRTWS